MWPHHKTLWVLFFLQYPVVEYICDLGINELSTLKCKLTACLGFASKSCLLTETVSSWFSRRANVAGLFSRLTTQEKGMGSFLFHLYYEELLCIIILELNH